MPLKSKSDILQVMETLQMRLPCGSLVAIDVNPDQWEREQSFVQGAVEFCDKSCGK